MLKQTLTLAISAAILAGCNTVSTKPLTEVELKNAATAELAKMFSRGQAIEGGLDESEVVYRAVMHNLDTRLRRLESTFALNRLEVDNLAMLPSLALNAGYSSRSNDSYSTSQVFGQPTPTGTYSVSSSADITSADLTATWNVLDMAMGYYNAKQSADKALIASERERRAGMDLVRQAKEAYWRAYAAQKLNGRVQGNIKAAEKALANIEQGVKAGAVTPLNALRQRKQVLEAVRQLEVLKQELDMATLDLSQIVNARPGEELNLKEAPMEIIELKESLADLEQRAYIQSPDIREQKYRERVAITDVKKVSASLFPSLRATASLQTSSDDFLQNSEWSQYGLNVGWNLINLANYGTLTGNAELGVEVEEARSLAVRMAVLAKTHIAYRDYRFSQQQFERAQELYEIETMLAEQNRVRERASVGTEVESLVSETAEILAELRRYEAYAKLVSAVETVQGTVGDDSEFLAVIDERNKRIADTQKAIADAKTRLIAADSAVVAIDQQSQTLQQEQALLPAKLQQNQNQLVALKAQLESAKQGMKLAQQQDKAATDELKKLDTQIASLNKEIADARSKIVNSQQFSVKEAQAVSSSMQGLNALNTERQSAVQQLLALNEQESKLFAAKLSGNENVDVAQVRKVAADRERITARLEDLNKEIQVAQDKSLEAQSKKADADRELASTQAVEAGLAAKLRVLQSQKALSEKQSALALQQVTRAKGEESQLNARVESLESEIKSAATRQKEISSTLAELPERRAKALEDKAKAEKTMREAEEKLGYLVGENA